MVTEYAMGTAIVAQRSDGEHASDRTLRLRDEEEQALADEAFRKALELIVGHRGELDQLAETLLAQEVVEREDIERVMTMPLKAHEPGPSSGLGIAAAQPDEQPS
jgi:ATP-dependent Zn protease